MQVLVYNGCMEQKDRIVYSERNAPKRAIVRSDGALYVLLLIGTFAAIALGYVLSKQFGIKRLYVQLALYGVLLIGGYAIYRLRLVDYLYELTEGEFRVVQAVGSKQKPIVTVPLNSITEVGVYRQTDAAMEPRTFRGSREKTTAVWFVSEGKTHVVCLNPSDKLRELLSEAAHADR